MADQTPKDPPLDPTNGAAKTEGTAPSSEKPDEQTLADHEQTLADADQTGSDSDQTSADSDQDAADSDQEASDRDLAQGGDRLVHDATRELRDHSTHRRGQTAARRAEVAADRDTVAKDRDIAAMARDEAAALQDEELAERDAVWAAERDAVPDTKPQQRTATNRKRALADRAAAAEARARAAEDRTQAARDREQAARDRAQAQKDRDALLHQLTLAETDVLTGARTRGPGLADLDLEIDRARRTRGELVVAYVDVVGLKLVNDTRGHSAGDEMLQSVVRAIRGQLRSYDLIVRLGGDEFLSVMSGATIEEACQRFEAVRATLAADTDHQYEIRIGFALLESAETSAQLIERADAALSL